MDEEKFKHEMSRSKISWDVDDNKDYWRGYMRGLRRRFHGENFGTLEEHEKWMSMVDDVHRKELGQGYRDGFMAYEALRCRKSNDLHKRHR